MYEPSWKSIYITITFPSSLGMSALDTTIVNVASTAITNEFSEFQLFGWIISAYMLTSSSSTPLYGKGSDIFGRHNAMQFAISVFAAGSLLGALSTDMTMLIIARGIQGIGQVSNARHLHLYILMHVNMLAVAERQ
jgi:MFS family permease